MGYAISKLDKTVNESLLGNLKNVVLFNYEKWAIIKCTFLFKMVI